MDWAAMLLLGAYHGINPGMGWLFAVALGMQQGSARGVWRALPPIALGHAAAVGVVVAAAVLAQHGDAARRAENRGRVDAGDAGALPAVAAPAPAFRRDAGRLPRSDDLVVPHGLRSRRRVHGAPVRDGHAGGRVGRRRTRAARGFGRCRACPGRTRLAVGIHSLAYLTVTALVAWIVYRKLGLALLRTAWFNLDWLWAGALVVTGVAVLLR